MTKTAKVTYYYFFRPTVLHDHAASRLVKIIAFLQFPSNFEKNKLEFFVAKIFLYQLPIILA